GVVHLFLHVCWRLAVLKEQAREGVPQVVEPHPPQLRLLEQLVEDSVAEIVAVERAAAFRAEDPVRHAAPAILEGLLLPRALKCSERVRQLSRHVDAASLAVLRCGDTAGDQVASDLDESTVE